MQTCRLRASKTFIVGKEMLSKKNMTGLFSRIKYYFIEVIGKTFT